MFYVEYQVEGFHSQTFRAGPYSADEVGTHYQDIATYTKVHSVRVVSKEVLDATKARAQAQ